MRRRFDIGFPPARVRSNTGGLHGRRHYLCNGLSIWVRPEVVLVSPTSRDGECDGETIVLPRDPEVLDNLAHDLMFIAEEMRK